MKVYVERDIQERHIIVSGFMGSGHEELGRDIARHLGRSVLDTRKDSLVRTQWAAHTSEADEIACRLESQVLMALCDLPPRVAILRAYPFVRRSTQVHLDRIGAASIFLDVPKRECERRIAPPEITQSQNPLAVRMGAAAGIRDLYRYEEINGIATRIADILIPAGDSGSATPLEDSLAALARLSLQTGPVSQPS